MSLLAELRDDLGNKIVLNCATIRHLQPKTSIKANPLKGRNLLPTEPESPLLP
jgi:hypothetical protein